MRAFLESEFSSNILPLSVYDEIGTDFFKIIRHKCEYANTFCKTEHEDVRDSASDIENISLDSVPSPIAVKKRPKRKATAAKNRPVKIAKTVPKAKARKNVSEALPTTVDSCDNSDVENSDQSDDSLPSPTASGANNLDYELNPPVLELDSESQDDSASDEAPDPEPVLEFRCDKCDESFRTQKLLTRHRNLRHWEERPFKCKDCNATFKMKKTLNDHELIHKGLKPYKCDVCQNFYRTKTNLRLHQRSHSGDKPYVCSYCGQRFKKKSTLQLHERIHTKEKPFSCDICDKTFRLRHHLSNHRKIHTGEKSYLCSECGHESRQVAHHIRHMKSHDKKCETCDLKFKTQIELKDHLFSEHGDTSQTVECVECSIVFATPSECDKHQKEVHKKKFICDICGTKLRYFSEVKAHELKHAMEKPDLKSKLRQPKEIDSAQQQALTLKAKKLKCPTCGLQCSSNAHFKIHSRTHTGERPYKCKSCDYSGNLKSQLTQHERIHTGEKPYQCDTCGKAFRLKNHLEVHKNIHLNVRPFKCDQCSSAFKQIGHLAFHKKHKHTGEMMYSCDECSAAFRLKKELVNHKLEHSIENPFKCETCGKFFGAEEQLEQHLKHHDHQAQIASNSATEEVLIPNEIEYAQNVDDARINYLNMFHHFVSK